MTQSPVSGLIERLRVYADREQTHSGFVLAHIDDLSDAAARLAEVEEALRQIEPFLRHTLGEAPPEGGWPYVVTSPLEVNPRIRQTLGALHDSGSPAEQPHEICSPIYSEERGRWWAECSCGWEYESRYEQDVKLALLEHRNKNPRGAGRVTEVGGEAVLPDGEVCACLSETGERKVRLYERCQRCGAFMEADYAAVAQERIAELERAYRQALQGWYTSIGETADLYYDALLAGWGGIEGYDPGRATGLHREAVRSEQDPRS